MVAKRSNRAVALLLAMPSAAFALGLGDIRLLSPLNAPLDAEIELVDVTPEELNSLQAQIASRETFAKYGLEWPVFLSSVQVRTVRGANGKEVIKLRSSDTITEPFITLLIEVNSAHGHLVREYTMLLDPPVYTPNQPALANTPVAAPAAGTEAREGSISRSSAEPAEPAAAPATAAATSPADSGASSMAAPQPEDATPAPAPAPAPSAPSPSPSSSAAAAGSTRVVKRGETLSHIAADVAGTRPNTAQAHSWMLAIYQANPRAFEQNMNLLRSGAVLRIPDTADVAAVSPSEAAAEIRRQYAAFRANGSPAVASTGPSRGELKLVTPSGSASVGTNEGGVAGTEVKALQSRVHDLEGQLGESKRLLEMRNAELADLQSRLAAKSGTAPAPEPQPEPAQPPAAAAQPPVAETESPAAAPAPAPAEEPVAQSADTAAPAAAAPETIPPPKPPAPKATPPVAESGSIFDTLKDFWWAGALLVAAIGGFIGFRMWRSRRESEFDDSLGRLAAVGASAVDRGFAAGDTSPMRPMGAAAPEGAFLVEESGSHERPRFGGGAAAAAPTAKHVATDDTISSETAINLDQGDPLAEADFHMAYGLYDQAADLIRIAISREPARRDLKLKLLEVFFVWGNKEQFLATAHELAETREESAPGEWEKIVIMGKQLAPDDPLFSGGAVGGASAGGVDLDLEGGQSRVDFDLLGEPVPGEAVGGDVDLDIGSALGDFDSTADATGATDRNSAIRGFGEGSTGTTRQMTARLPRDNHGLEGFGAENEGPTVEQPALTTPENPTIRQKVEMALKQSGAEQTAELAIDDLGLDLGALDTVDQPGFGASPDAPTLVAGMDERSRKVIEEAQRRAAEEQHASATGAWRLDESELEPALANGHDEAVEHGISETSRLSALAGGGDVDFDIGGATGAHHVANGAGLDLDVGTATMPDAAFTATQKISADDLALPDLEPVTMSEVGTKLDLARAYMDMGDPDGARNILEEVLHEGSVAQKQEAQRLMESLPG